MRAQRHDIHQGRQMFSQFCSSRFPGTFLIYLIFHNFVESRTLDDYGGASFQGPFPSFPAPFFFILWPASIQLLLICNLPSTEDCRSSKTPPFHASQRRSGYTYIFLVHKSRVLLHDPSGRKKWWAEEGHDLLHPSHTHTHTPSSTCTCEGQREGGRISK